MKKLLLLLLLVASPVYASDYHQNGQQHRIVYVVTDNTGKPVSGQTVNLALERSSDNQFYDFSSNTFKNTGWTTRVTAMSYDTVAENYFKVIQIDNGTLVSGDVVCLISNDSATYGDRQAESINFDTISTLIKIHR